MSMIYKTFENFLTRNECRHIINLCKDRVRQGLSPDPKNHFKPVADTHQCNNQITWLSPQYDAVIKGISERIAKETGFGIEYFEPIQILKYETGGYYKLHLDNSYDDNPRKATFQIYLNDVEEGGETIFPHQGMGFRPKRGRAAFWLNFEDDDYAAKVAASRLTADPTTLHEGALIKKGQKWSYTQWIKLRPIGTPNPMAQKPEGLKTGAVMELRPSSEPTIVSDPLPEPAAVAGERPKAARKVRQKTKSKKSAGKGKGKKVKGKQKPLPVSTAS